MEALPMKIIDQTPFYNEKGEISLVDRAKAILKFGKSWLDEVEAQKSVIPVLEKNLERNYTLLRNVVLPDLDMSIPFILVGPTGIYVIYVTGLTGMFRAKGDQWGTIIGSTFKDEKPNLLTRTERMARAVQVYLQRHGYFDLHGAEAVLLCADAGVHVDSLRPIVRIVMCDALERFVISVTQSRVVLSPEAVYDVVNRILNPPTPKEETPAPEAGETPVSGEQEPGPGEAAYAPAFTAPDDGPASERWGDALPVSWAESQPPSPVEETPQPPVSFEESPQPPVLPDAESQPPPLPRRGINKKQWLFLAAMFLVWCLLIAIFIYLVVKDLYL
jgi:hypothetical protein